MYAQVAWVRSVKKHSDVHGWRDFQSRPNIATTILRLNFGWKLRKEADFLARYF